MFVVSGDMRTERIGAVLEHVIEKFGKAALTLWVTIWAFPPKRLAPQNRIIYWLGI